MTVRHHRFSTILVRGILVLCLLASASASARGNSALGIYKQGMKQYRKGDYRAAITQFQRAYDLSKHPNNLYYLGESHRRLGQLKKSFEFYERFTTTLTGKKQREFQAKLHKLRWGSPCKISVSSSPAGAMVVVDGVKKGRTPAGGAPLVLSIPGGEHEVMVELKGRAPSTRKLAAEFGAPQALSFALDKIPGPATVLLQSSVKGAEVALDGVVVGNAPMELEVAPGKHRILVARTGYKAFKREFSVRPDERLLLRVVLEPSAGAPRETAGVTPPAAEPAAGVSRKLDEPGRREDQGKGGVRRNPLWIVAGATTAALAVGGLVLGLVYNDKHNDEFEDSPDAATYGNIAVTGYILAGSFAVLSAVSFIVYGVSTSPAPDRETAGLKVFFGPPPRGSGFVMGGGGTF